MYLVLFLVDYSRCVKKLLRNFEETFLFFMISIIWPVNYQMVLLFYMSLSSACLIGIRQLRELRCKILS